MFFLGTFVFTVIHKMEFKKKLFELSSNKELVKNPTLFMKEERDRSRYLIYHFL